MLVRFVPGNGANRTIGLSRRLLGQGSHSPAAYFLTSLVDCLNSIYLSLDVLHVDSDVDCRSDERCAVVGEVFTSSRGVCNIRL